MPIELTNQQQLSLDANGHDHPRVIDPRTRECYVLVPEVEYEEIREAIEEDRRQRAIRAAGLRNAIGRMGEDS
jgi:hypothetical protein